MANKKSKPLNIDLGKLPEVNIKEAKNTKSVKRKVQRRKKESEKEAKKPGPMNKVPSDWKKTSIKIDPKVLERLKIFIVKTEKYETRDQLLNDLLTKFLGKKDI